jgi:16S rRNA (guanine527-N7)-methyltransferase
VAGTRLVEVLEDGRERGFLGPGPVQPHIDHAEALAELLGPFAGRFVDLGSGAGIPGLVLARAWPGCTAILLDSGTRRCRFLTGAVQRLGMTNRVSVACGRAEELARSPGLRDAHPLAVARGFGPPAVVAECGAAFLADGGSLVVTEPPPTASTSGQVPATPRWPAAGLAELGLALDREVRNERAGAVVLTKTGATPDRWPRRPGIPRKRPLW